MSIDIELSACVDDRETRLDGPLTCTAKAQEGAQAKAKPGTHLYIVQDESGRVKIGRSTDPRRRIRGFQTASGHKMTLLLILHDQGGEELAFHRALASHRGIGEWFRDTPEFRQTLSALAGRSIRFQETRKERNAREEREMIDLEISACAAIVARARKERADREERRALRARIEQRKAARRASATAGIPTEANPPTQGANNA